MAKLSIRDNIRTLSPAYFALPMSTGIIAIASYTLGYTRISNFLSIVNDAELIILFLLLIGRLIFFFPEVKKNLSTHAVGAGFLTIVAALCIWESRKVLLKNDFTFALTGWLLSMAIWILLIYSFFLLITFKKHKPSLEKGINGSWLLFVVSTQALSITGNLIFSHFGIDPEVALFVTLLLYLLGAILYLIIIGLIFYRTTFFLMTPREFKPSFWINMGAAAISTLAGSVLINVMQDVIEFQSFIPIMKLLTMLFWVEGTWWIPIVASMAIWKRRRLKLTYSADYWSLVFPLGVYTFCTWHLAEVLSLPFLKRIPDVFIYFAWIAWIVTYLKMGGYLKKLLKAMLASH